jgi:hypothetical protein
MRENRTCGSEGGEANNLPDPYQSRHENRWRPWVPAFAGTSGMVQLSA